MATTGFTCTRNSYVHREFLSCIDITAHSIVIVNTDILLLEEKGEDQREDILWLYFECDRMANVALRVLVKSVNSKQTHVLSKVLNVIFIFKLWQFRWSVFQFLLLIGYSKPQISLQHFLIYCLISFWSSFVSAVYLFVFIFFHFVFFLFRNSSWFDFLGT